MRTWTAHARRLAAGSALLLTLVLVLCACSATDLGGSGIGLTGFGSTSLVPAGTPTVQGRDPGGTYAFVYGNQVWIKHSQDTAPKQLTHLALSAGTRYSWGALVWSPDAKHVAFALGQSDEANDPADDGALYIVDTSSGNAQLTAGTSSIYGHTYAWYGTNALFYATGTGVQLYDFSNPGDPRAYTAVVGSNGPDYSASGNPHYILYADLAFLSQTMYITRMDVGTLGGSGTVGTAAIYAYGVPVAAGDYSGGGIASPRYGLSGYQVVDLGRAYADAHGNVVAGPWGLADDGGIAFGRVSSVDTAAGTVKSSICYGSTVGNCYPTLFQAVSTFPLDSRPQFGFTADGGMIAFGGPNVSIEKRSGAGFVKLAPAATGQPPDWSPDGAALAVTQPVAPSGASATQQQATMNVVIYAGGKSSLFISGAQGLSWAPGR